MTKNVQLVKNTLLEIFRPVHSLRHCLLNSLDFVFLFISSVLIQITICFEHHTDSPCTQTQSWLRSAFRLQTMLCSQKINSFRLRKNKVFGTLSYRSFFCRQSRHYVGGTHIALCYIQILLIIIISLLGTVKTY